MTRLVSRVNHVKQCSSLRVLTLLFVAVAAAGCGTPCVPNQKSTAAVPRHPADAVAFGGHWYKAFDNDTSWHAAMTNCAEAGGYLACIETESEQAFIAKLADGRYLSLGATDEESEGAWRWINGAPFKYQCWMEGQPNNYGGCEHYLATYDGGEWVDVADDGDGFWMPTGYICEWER